MKALILAGGRGTRLLPYTHILPKPLIPIGNIPIAELLIMQLADTGIKDIIMSVGYLAHLIKMYFGDGSKLGVNITYIEETEPTGTFGSLRLLDEIQEPLFIINGDEFTNLSYTKFIGQHKVNGNDMSISVYDKKYKLEYGVIENVDGNILCIEKPEQVYTVNMGIYIINSNIHRFIINNFNEFPVDANNVINAVAEDNNYTIGMIKKKCIWFDIGKKEDYDNAVEYFINNKTEFVR